MRNCFCFVVGLLLLADLTKADTVQMKSGNRIECVVLQENSGSVVIQRGYASMTLPREAIDHVEKAAAIKSVSSPSTQPVAGQRVPALNTVLASLLKQPWSSDLQQIPATVIDNGVMQFVPYQSYRCGKDYEINIYGDLDHPAAVEIGIYHDLLTRDDIKRQCVQFIASLMLDKSDASLVQAIGIDKNEIERNGLTVEVTPQTDPDAYNGWWVSVYSRSKLEEAKASPAELKQIAVAKDSTFVPTSQLVEDREKKAAERARRSAFADDANSSWTTSDMSQARPSSSGAAVYTGSGYAGSSSSGSVYVRGYTRSNGTYVSGYARAAPGYGSGRVGGHR